MVREKQRFIVSPNYYQNIIEMMYFRKYYHYEVLKMVVNLFVYMRNEKHW